MSISHAVPATMPRTPQPSPGVSLHLLGMSGLLFNRYQQQIYAANTCATFIWCCLEEGMSSDEIVAGLERRFGFGEDEGRYYFDGIVAHWRVTGLVDTPPGTRSAAGAETFLPQRDPEFAAGARVFPGTACPAAVAAVYGLLDTAFTMEFSSRALYEAVHPNIAHLAVHRVSRLNCRLELRAERDRIVLYANRREYDYCDAIDEVAPMVMSSMAVIAMGGSVGTYAVHAGAVLHGDTCIMLPGASGAGKSTLVAILAAEGFDALADDTVLLTGSPLSLRPVSLGICLKPGSWLCVKPYYPDVDRLPIHHRADGKSVRYITAAGLGDPRLARATYTTDALVFPRYMAGSAGELTAIDSSTALLRLMDGTHLLNTALSAADIDSLISWIAATRCYELRYSSAPEAAALLRGIDG